MLTWATEKVLDQSNLLREIISQKYTSLINSLKTRSRHLIYKAKYLSDVNMLALSLKYS